MDRNYEDYVLFVVAVGEGICVNFLEDIEISTGLERLLYIGFGDKLMCLSSDIFS